MKIILSITTILLSLKLYSYDQLDRFILHEDRLKTLEEFVPYGDDFVLPLDLYAAASPDSMDLLDDAERIDKLEGSNNDKIEEGKEILKKYDRSEHIIHVKPINMNVRLPSFHLFKMRFVPSLRIRSQAGFLLGVRTNALNLTGETALLFLPSSFLKELPDQAINYIKNKPSFTLGAPVLGAGECVAAGLTGTPALDALCTAAQSYVIPASDSATIFAYGKGEAKAGFHFNYYSPNFKKKGNYYFYGDFFPYFTARSDLKVAVAAETLAAGVNPIDDYKPTDNLQTFVMLDYRLGYMMKPFDVFVSFEEIKIAESSDKTKQTEYENDMLVRAHGRAQFSFGALKLMPFAGVHKRSNYDLADGLYVGTQLGLSFWGDRFKLMGKAMMDKEYFTLGANLKFWIMHLDPYVKLPVKSEVDDVKTPTVVGLNLRVVQF